MNDKELYKQAKDFLLSQEGINKSDLEQHMEPELHKPNDFNKIYQRLCESAQNRQMSTNVIGNSIGGVEKLGKVLFDFDPHKVANKYLRTDKERLFADIELNLKPTGQMRNSSRSLWPQFCQSVIDSAHFLKTFKSPDKFYEWADFFAQDNRAKPALPWLISNEITGIGFALACDFLKELGYNQYGKPDVQLKDIFGAIGLLNGPIQKQDLETLKVIDRIASANNVTPYMVDKVFWLIGSGDFYRTGKTIQQGKNDFIKQIIK